MCDGWVGDHLIHLGCLNHLVSLRLPRRPTRDEGEWEEDMSRGGPAGLKLLSAAFDVAFENLVPNLFRDKDKGALGLPPK